MNAVNPRYVLRNYLAQLAIDDAERGDPSLITSCSTCCVTPTTSSPDGSVRRASAPSGPATAPGCSMLSCSS